MTRPFPLHPLRGEHVVCVTSFLHLSAFHFIYLFPSPPIRLHAMYFCDFLREEFIEMRVLQPDGSASTSLFSLPPCLPAPPLICSLSSLLSFKCHFVWDTGVRTWEDLQRQRLRPVRRLLYHLFNPRPLLTRKSSPSQNRLSLRLFPEVVCSGRPPAWMQHMRTFVHILGHAFHVFLFIYFFKEI